MKNNPGIINDRWFWLPSDDEKRNGYHVTNPIRMMIYT